MGKEHEERNDNTVSGEEIVNMLASLCRLVERGYDPEMIRRVKGLRSWWTKEKTRHKAEHGLSDREQKRMKQHYARLFGDMERCDPDMF